MDKKNKRIPDTSDNSKGTQQQRIGEAASVKAAKKRNAAEEPPQNVVQEKAAVGLQSPSRQAKKRNAKEEPPPNVVQKEAAAVGNSKQQKTAAVELQSPPRKKTVDDSGNSAAAAESLEQQVSRKQEQTYAAINAETLKVTPLIGPNPNLLITQYSSSPEVTAVNGAIQQIQNEILSTIGANNGIPPNTPSNNDPFDLSKIYKNGPKGKNGFVPYDRTVRTQTLVKYGAPSENLLQIPGVPIKGTIAFQQQDNNPNGVLAVALTKALNYLLINRSQGVEFKLVIIVEEKKKSKKKLSDEGGDEDGDEDGDEEGHEEGNKQSPKNISYNAAQCFSMIEQIKNAARGAKVKIGSDITFKIFNDALLNKFYEAVVKDAMTEDKIIAIIGVYGSFLNKGLSDTAQGGELIKVWLLKFIEKFQPEDQPPDINAIAGEHPYWNITHGIPYLKLLSSDKIASALYIELIELFEGGMTSIQPYKSSGGESSVFCLRKKYVGLILAMTQKDDPANQILHTFANECLKNLNGKLNIDGGDAYLENLLLKINEIIQCLYGLKADSDYMNIYDIINEIETNKEAIIRYLKTCYDLKAVPNPELLPEYMQQNAKCIDLLFKVLGGLYGDSYNTDLNLEFFFRMQYLRQIINCFSVFIQELSEYVEAHNLEEMFDAMSGETTRPQAYSMIAETVGYYRNCIFLRRLTLEQCVEKYLEVCRQELFCALTDVKNGHDQQDVSPEPLQKLGEIFMLILCDSNPAKLPDIMKKSLQLPLEKRYKVDEDQISKMILDLAGFVSVAQIGTNQITFKKTSSHVDDFINSHTYITSFQEKFPIGAVCNQIYTSIDFVVRNPLETISKVDLKNNRFNTFTEFEYFIENSRAQEVRTVSTFADLAAPAGCIYAVVGNMAISYIIFYFTDKDRNTSRYIYLISTFDLGGNQTTNDNNFKKNVCIAQAVDDRFTQIFTSEELRRYPTAQVVNNLHAELEKFSQKLVELDNKDNKIVSFIEKIEDIFKKNLGLKAKTTPFYIILIELVDFINALNNELRSIKGKPGKITATINLERKIKTARFNAFQELKGLLKERYIKIYETVDDIKQQGLSIPPVISDEIIDITTFLQIVNGFSDFGLKVAMSKPNTNFAPRARGVVNTSTSPMASSQRDPFGHGTLGSSAATFLSQQASDVFGLDDLRARAALSSPATPQKGVQRANSVRSVGSDGSVTYAEQIPYWYYLLTNDPSETWFRRMLPSNFPSRNDIIKDYEKGQLPLDSDIVRRITFDMAKAFCVNLSTEVQKAREKKNPDLIMKTIESCIKSRSEIYSGLFVVEHGLNNSIKRDIKLIQQYTEQKSQSSEAGGAKRTKTRKHKLNKNHRKTKHINKLNRKRKTKRLIKNKRRFTKKR